MEVPSPVATTFDVPFAVRGTSNIICERIELYNKELKIVNTCTLLQVGNGISPIHGLGEGMIGFL